MDMVELLHSPTSIPNGHRGRMIYPPRPKAEKREKLVEKTSLRKSFLGWGRLHFFFFLLVRNAYPTFISFLPRWGLVIIRLWLLDNRA